jgi:hypothetical protein
MLERGDNNTNVRAAPNWVLIRARNKI